MHDIGEPLMLWLLGGAVFGITWEWQRRPKPFRFASLVCGLALLALGVSRRIWSVKILVPFGSTTTEIFEDAGLLFMLSALLYFWRMSRRAQAEAA